MSDPFKEKESKDRKDKFLKEYEQLVKRYDVALMPFPEFVPSGTTGFNISAVMAPFDKRSMNVPSPMQGDNGELAK